MAFRGSKLVCLGLVTGRSTIKHAVTHKYPYFSRLDGLRESSNEFKSLIRLGMSTASMLHYQKKSKGKCREEKVLVRAPARASSSPTGSAIANSGGSSTFDLVVLFGAVT